VCRLATLTDEEWGDKNKDGRKQEREKLRED
jgi:hypothetical protein